MHGDHMNVPAMSASLFICHMDLDSCSQFMLLPSQRTQFSHVLECGISVSSDFVKESV